MNPRLHALAEKHKHGILIRNPIAIPDFVEISKAQPPESTMHPGVAWHYNSVIAMGKPEELDKWAAEIEASIQHLPPAERYLKGTKGGASAHTIFSALAPTEELRKGITESRSFSPSTPHDAGDFGRCQYLLGQMPGWRNRLQEVAAAYPSSSWGQLIPVWPELERLKAAGENDKLRQCIAKATEERPANKPTVPWKDHPAQAGWWVVRNISTSGETAVYTAVETVAKDGKIVVPESFAGSSVKVEDNGNGWLGPFPREQAIEQLTAALKQFRKLAQTKPITPTTPEIT